jgi:hypothetical protein
MRHQEVLPSMSDFDDDDQGGFESYDGFHYRDALKPFRGEGLPYLLSLDEAFTLLLEGCSSEDMTFGEVGYLTQTQSCRAARMILQAYTEPPLRNWPPSPFEPCFGSLIRDLTEPHSE